MVGTPAGYLESVAGRLKADGCQVSEQRWPGGTVLVGYRSDFRLRWMATRLHLFTVVCAVPHVGRPDVEAFTTAVLDYALSRAGSTRGMQAGIAALPCLVSDRIDPAALDWARQKQRQRFAAMARPVIVDPVQGTVTCYRGTGALGGIYAGHLRRKLDTYFPRTTG